MQAAVLIRQLLDRCGVKDLFESEEVDSFQVVPNAVLENVRQIGAMLHSVASDRLTPELSRAWGKISTLRDLCAIWSDLECWCDEVWDMGDGLKDELLSSESEE